MRRSSPLSVALFRSAVSQKRGRISPDRQNFLSDAAASGLFLQSLPGR
jgi:hypothetical protein